MAKARTLEKRRKSIKNIRKITRTMELASTAQFRRAMERAVAADAYVKRINRLACDLAKGDHKIEHPLLAERKSTKKAVLIVLTANRGLCAGYNSGVLRAGTARLEELREAYEEIELFVSGKRGISHLKYHGYEIARTYTHFNHRPSYEEALVIADEMLNRYRIGEIDRFDVAYSKFETLSKQYPTVETLLPLPVFATEGDESGDGSSAALDYEFLPSPQSILEEIVPYAFKVKFFKTLLDAAVSEQVARMIAMKAATDNADQMISTLTSAYNRARQSQITNEIIEVISGASALQ